MNGKTIEKVALICADGENGEKILFVRSHNKDKFYLPGGKIDPGETELEALVREAREELSVELRPDTVRRLGTISAQADGKADGVTVRTTCYTAEFDGDPTPASEIAELAWLGKADADRLSETGRLALEKLEKLKETTHGAF